MCIHWLSPCQLAKDAAVTLACCPVTALFRRLILAWQIDGDRAPLWQRWLWIHGLSPASLSFQSWRISPVLSEPGIFLVYLLLILVIHDYHLQFKKHDVASTHLTIGINKTPCYLPLAICPFILKLQNNPEVASPFSIAAQPLICNYSQNKVAMSSCSSSKSPSRSEIRCKNPITQDPLLPQPAVDLIWHRLQIIKDLAFASPVSFSHSFRN